MICLLCGSRLFKEVGETQWRDLDGDPNCLSNISDLPGIDVMGAGVSVVGLHVPKTS